MVPTNGKHSTTAATSVHPKADERRRYHAPRSATKHDRVQGEGDYQSAREFNKLERKFGASRRVAAAARVKSLS